MKLSFLSYGTLNIGDDIQSIAAKSFIRKKLPNIKSFDHVDREYLATYNGPKRKIIMNGWFMHHKDLWYPGASSDRPSQSWPPNKNLQPVLISMHLAHYIKSVYNLLTHKDSLSFFEQHGPVGARDLSTLLFLQEHNIPSYYSGCLTLTLDNTFKSHEREDIIYVNDLDQSCVEYIRKKTSSRVETLTHLITSDIQKSQAKREQYAQSLLKKYQTCKCVITSRLHAALPCLAFGTPVLLIHPNQNLERRSRFSGLQDLLRSCLKEDLVRDKVDFDFKNPPQNFPEYQNSRMFIEKKLFSLIRI